MNIATDHNDYWTVPQLSKHIQKHRGTIIGWIRSGRLKTRRIGKEYRIYKADFEDFLAACNGGRRVEI